MKTIHTEIWVAAAAPLVWDVVTDTAGWEDWNPVMRLEGAFEVGQPLTVTFLPPGKAPVVLTPTLVRHDEGHEVRWRGRLFLPGLCDAEHGFRVVPEDTGRCRFEQFEVFRGLLVGPLVARRAREIETGFQVMNRMLKREAERRARAGIIPAVMDIDG